MNASHIITTYLPTPTHTHSAGIQMFVGGGVLVNAGFNYISVNGALMRGAFGLFSVGM